MRPSAIASTTARRRAATLRRRRRHAPPPPPEWQTTHICCFFLDEAAMLERVVVAVGPRDSHSSLSGRGVWVTQEDEEIPEDLLSLSVEQQQKAIKWRSLKMMSTGEHIAAPDMPPCCIARCIACCSFAGGSRYQAAGGCYQTAQSDLWLCVRWRAQASCWCCCSRTLWWTAYRPSAPG